MAVCQPYRKVNALYDIQVAIVAGFHLFPFRTEKLSPFTPMVLRKWESRSLPSLKRFRAQSEALSFYIRILLQYSFLLGRFKNVSDLWSLILVCYANPFPSVTLLAFQAR